MRTAIALTFAVLLAACGSNADSPPANVASSPAIEAWLVDSLEHTRILGVHGRDSLTPFGDVVGLARVADSGFVVADGGESDLKYFDIEGGYARTVGGNGAGPSEFMRLTDMLKCGDSLFVRDISLRKYKVFSLDGKFARSFDIPVHTSSRQAMLAACNSSGTFIHNAFETTRDLPARSQALRSDVPYWLSSSSGELRADLGMHAGMDRWFTRGPNGGGGMTALPLGRQPIVAIGAARAYIGTADSFAIDVFALDGKMIGTISKPGKVQSPSSADIEHYKMRDTTGKPAARIAMIVREWQEIEFSKTLPAYTAFVVDSAQNLWVRGFPPADGSWVEWSVFGADLKQVARILIPATLRVTEIGSDWILGVDVDPATGVGVPKSFTLRHQPFVE